MISAPKTVLCIHDLPGFGRASLSVILPVLSALGVQPVALPTAVLSTHTGGLGTPARLSNPGYGPAALAHYKRLGIRFDCIYSGYLADAGQAHLVQQALELWPDALAIVDPVLGDHGKLYSGLSDDMIPAMRGLCARAGLILPNPTEAALLLGDVPSASPSLEIVAQQAARLTTLCPQVVVTGVPAGRRSIACVGAQRDGGGFVSRSSFIPRLYHGTGDIFGAVVAGKMMQGNVTEAAVQTAAAFVIECIRATPEGADERLGVWLERALPLLNSDREGPLSPVRRGYPE